MIDVAVQWFKEGIIREKVVWLKMPQVPAPGDTIHIPFLNEDRGGEEDSIALTVKRVTWARDDEDHTSDGAGWHAEIWMYGPGEYH